MVDEGGRLQIVVPEALSGSPVEVTIRRVPREEWLRRVGNGTLTGPSLSDEATSRDSIYSDEH